MSTQLYPRVNGFYAPDLFSPDEHQDAARRWAKAARHWKRYADSGHATETSRLEGLLHYGECLSGVLRCCGLYAAPAGPEGEGKCL